MLKLCFDATNLISELRVWIYKIEPGEGGVDCRVRLMHPKEVKEKEAEKAMVESIGKDGRWLSG